MERIAELGDQELEWTQPRALKMQFELRADGELAATIKFRSSFGSFATAESADGCWTFKRVGFLATRVTIRTCNEDQEIAAFKNNTWSGGGTLELPEGRKILVTTNLWGSKLEFRTESGQTLLQFSNRGVIHLSATVEIDRETLKTGEPWLVMLGWYLIVMMHMDAAAGLVEEYGSPLYVFSEKRIADNTRNLRRAVESVFPRIKLCYASKANSNMAVLATVLRAGGDIEVNSGGELFKAKKVGFKPDQIIFNGVSKTDQELRDAIEYGILAINVDSLYELDQAARVARAAGKRANVAIRIVPEIVTRSHIGLQTGLLSSKFGLSPSQIDESFQRALAASDAINLVGVHIHLGSQTPDPHPFAAAFAEMWSFLVGLFKRTGHRLSLINIGGGLPVNYLPDTPMAGQINAGERAMLSAQLDPNQVLRDALADAVVKDEPGLLEGLTIVLEPGRRIVGDAGLILTRVCNFKDRPETGDRWLLTDAGYSLMISLSTYKWYYHLISASRAGEPHSTPYKVAGPLCDSGDVYFDMEGTRLPNYRLLPEGTAPGEVLALLNTGAYALDQSSQYNGRPRPAVVMVRESGEVSVVRRPETYEDLFSLDKW